MSKLRTLVGLVAFAVATSVMAQTAGDKGSVMLNYNNFDVKDRPNYEGYGLDVHIPFAKTTQVTPLNWTGDVSVTTVKNNGSHSNVSSVRGGLTTKFTAWGAVQPYFSFGVQNNYGNFTSNVENYWAYYVEPGVRWNINDSFYSFASYEYGEGFNADVGSVRNMPKVGLGVNFTKNLGVEARYEMNQGSYDYNRLVIVVNYTF